MGSNQEHILRLFISDHGPVTALAPTALWLDLLQHQMHAFLHQNIILVLLVPASNSSCSVHSPLSSSLQPFLQRDPGWRILSHCSRAEPNTGELPSERSYLPFAHRSSCSQLQRVFNHITPGKQAARGLFNLMQGGRSVSNYFIEFHFMEAESNWNAHSLFDTFYNGLSDIVRDVLVDLDAIVTLTIRTAIFGNIGERENPVSCSAGSTSPVIPSSRVLS
eukprot:superscaffoldBa00002939_g15691